jgi:hypothetical protein
MDEISISGSSRFSTFYNSLEYAHCGRSPSCAAFLYHFGVLYGLNSWEEVSTQQAGFMDILHQPSREDFSCLLGCSYRSSSILWGRLDLDPANTGAISMV